jgi:hypothetical protein
MSNKKKSLFVLSLVILVILFSPYTIVKLISWAGEEDLIEDVNFDWFIVEEKQPVKEKIVHIYIEEN